MQSLVITMCKVSVLPFYYIFHVADFLVRIREMPMSLSWMNCVLMKVENAWMEKKLEELRTKMEAMKMESESKRKEVWTQCGLVKGHDKAIQTDPYRLVTKEGVFSTTEASTNTGLMQGVTKGC